MTYGSLFAGIGGIDLGMDAAGFECRWQVEKDEDCCKVLAKHWPNVKRYGDITQIETDELEHVDAIVGGFPCQDLSQAGKRKGFHHEDGTATRSGLWFEFARIIGALRPRYVLAENVPGLLTQPGAMGAVLGELARLGYVGSWRCLRASEFGASHLRKRVFIVGHNLAHAQQQSRRAEQFDGAREREDCAAFHGSVLGVESAGDELAHGPSGGRGELRESPRRDGQPDGSGEVLADAERPRSGRGFRESHAQQNGYGAEGGSSELANAASPRSEGGETPEARFFPTPASRDYRTPNNQSYQERSGTKKGEQLQNFVAHSWPTPRTTDTQSGRGCEQIGTAFYRPSKELKAGEMVGQANLSDVAEYLSDSHSLQAPTTLDGQPSSPSAPTSPRRLLADLMRVLSNF